MHLALQLQCLPAPVRHTQLMEDDEPDLEDRVVISTATIWNNIAKRWLWGVDVDDMSMLAAEELWFYVVASKHFNMLNEFNVGSLEWCFPHFSAYISLSLCCWMRGRGLPLWYPLTMPIADLSSTIHQFPETRPLQPIISPSNQNQPPNFEQGKRSKRRKTWEIPT